MSKPTLVFTGYREDWEETTVAVVVNLQLNGQAFSVSSLPLSQKRATSEVVRRTALSTMQEAVEDAIFRIGMRASDYDRELKAILKEFNVFLHKDFREQCEEYEIPFNHLLNA